MTAPSPPVTPDSWSITSMAAARGNAVPQSSGDAPSFSRPASCSFTVWARGSSSSSRPAPIALHRASICSVISGGFQHLAGLGEHLGEAADGGDGGPLQLAVDELVIFHHHIAAPDHLQGEAAVQADGGLFGQHGGAQQVGPQGGGQPAGALEVQAGEGVLELRQLEQLEHHVAGHQQGVHGVGVELGPEIHQGVVVQDLAGLDGGDGGGVGVAVPLDEYVYRVLQVGAGDVGANLPQSDGKQVQLLEADGLIAGHQHAAPLFQLDQVGLRLDGGGGNLGSLLYGLRLLVLAPGLGGDGAVVQAVDPCDGGGDAGEDVPLLNALAHGAGDVLGEEDGGVGGLEKDLHRVAGLPLHLDIEPLELPLKGVQPLQAGALVALAGVLPLQHLAEGTASLPIHPLVQLQVVVTVCHIS